MTVAELIEKLKEFPDHYIVQTFENEWGWEDIDSSYVESNEDYQKVRIG